jgi:DNA-binding PadR family transcriptional regulator
MREVSGKSGLHDERFAASVKRLAALNPAWSTRFALEQTPPRMDVKFPILGFLMEAEATGYDLKRRFQDPVGFFYRVSDGSIYPALKKLAHDGLVTVRSEAQGRRARKVYAITAAGRAHFTRMLREPAQPLFVFDESQVKIYFADRHPEIALEHMERARRDDQARAAYLGALVAQMNRAGDPAVRRIVVELGRAITEAKAQVLGRLCAELRRDIQLKRRLPARPTRATPAATAAKVKRRGLTRRTHHG